MRHAAFVKRTRGLSLVWLVLAAGGCRGIGGGGLTPKLSRIPEMLTQEKHRELGPMLQHFSAYFQSELADCGAQIAAKTDDPRVLRATLVGRIKLTPAVQNLLASSDAASALLDTWTLCVRLTRYLRDGEGRELFGQQQPQAVETAGRLQARIEQVAHDYVPQGDWEKLTQQVEAYAKDNPIRGMFAYATPAPFSEAEQGRSVVETVLGAPARAVQGVSQGLDPTLKLSQSVDRIRDRLETYPNLVRWQTQLAALDLDRIPPVQTLVRGISDVSQSAVRLTAVAENLPERLRSESQKLLDDFDSRQPQWQKTLDELRQTVDAAQDALQQATQAGQAWQQTADAATQAVKQVAQFSEKNRGPETQPAAPPFDINDYTRTAEAFTATARQLRSLLQDLRDFLGGETTPHDLKRIDALTGSALNQTAAELRQEIDHAAWRGAELIGLAFVLLVIYRLLTRLLPRRDAR